MFVTRFSACMFVTSLLIESESESERKRKRKREGGA
jgi:hypothetical protein